MINIQYHKNVNREGTFIFCKNYILYLKKKKIEIYVKLSFFVLYI